MRSNYSGGLNVLVIFLFYFFFSDVKTKKAHCLNKWKITRANNMHDSLFMHNIQQSRKEYHLHTKHKKKEFVNYKEIQIKRINDYRKRCGADRNNINYSKRDRYNYHENLLFVRNEVLPTLAKIENEKNRDKVKEKYSQAFMNINDYNSAFDRETFLQFMIDLYNIFLKIDEIFIIHKKHFSPLIYIGPMILTNHLYDDIIFLSSTVQNNDVTVSEYGREYIGHLEDLCEKNKFKFLAHAYSFYKNFHLAKEHLLNSICKYLNIIKKLKSSTYVPDVSNFEHCLNKMSRNWDRWEKDMFLSGLYDATDKMMILTRHFQKTKE